MGFLNVEIKAHCSDPAKAEFILMQENAEFRGLDHQVDTYFNVSSGRLKLREGNIEHALIHYERENQEGPKSSQVILYQPQEKDPALSEALTRALGVLIVVDKRRKIFFIDNVKFHIDEVAGLGHFLEIEAIDRQGHLGPEKLRMQCDHYLKVLGISEADLVAVSYSDLLLKEME
jgi:predicted adenylyl cyclase CyaB